MVAEGVVRVVPSGSIYQKRYFSDLARTQLECLSPGAKVVPAASRVDALHVALASVAGADAVVSWNFKHLVQLRRIRGFHAVNVLRGYPLIEIRSPLELIDDEA